MLRSNIYKDDQRKELPCSLLAVTQHLVGLLDRIEYPSALLYPVLVLVRVVLERQLTVSLLQIGLRNVSWNA